MKQYIKSKSIKWGFKFWFCCSNKSDYQYQMKLMKERNTRVQSRFGEEVVLQLTKDLERLFCNVYFNNFFNSPNLIEKLFQKGIYGVGTGQAKGIYQITKQCQNDVCTLQSKVKKIQNIRYLFGLQHSIMLSKGKKLSVVLVLRLSGQFLYFFYERYFKCKKHKQKHLSNIQPNISKQKTI